MAVAVGLALSIGPAWGTDVLVGNNGERLPGRLVSQNADWIEFESDLLGRVRVPTSRARVEAGESDAALAASPVPHEAGAEDPQEPVHSASVDALVPTEPDAAASEPPVEPAPAKAVWARQFGVSGKKDRGTRDTPVDEFELNWRVSRTLVPNRSFLELAYRYKRENDLVKDDDWKLRLRHEHEIAERRFNAVQFTHSGQVEDDGRRTVRVLSAVTGWRLVDTERLQFAVAPGYALARGSDPVTSASSHGPVLFTSWDWAVYRELRLSGVLTMLSALGDSDEYVLETDMRLDWPVTEHLGVALSWDYQRNEFEFNPGNYSRLRWLLTWRP
jgi:hypothetical protein